MNEKYISLEQIKKPATIEPGLTANRASSYAEYGVIFMPEAVVDSVAPAIQEAEVRIANEDELKLANSLSEDEIETANKQNESHWAQSIMPEKKDKAIQAGDEELVSTLTKYGISPEQFAANPEFYRNNRTLFEGKANPKEVARLIHVWKKYFESIIGGKDEYEKKWQVIVTLAIAAGLSPKGFARKFKWSAYFEIEPPPTVGGVIKQIVKDVIVDVLYGVVKPHDDPAKSPEDNRTINEERKQAFAKVLWGAANKKRKDKGEKLELVELATQDELIKRGALPEVRTDYDTEYKRLKKENVVGVAEPVVRINSKLEADERIREAESLLGVKLTDVQKASLLKAHEVGMGLTEKDGKPAEIYNFTLEQIAEKARILRDGAGEEKSEAPLFTRDQRRALMEAGLAGASEMDDEGEGERDQRADNKTWQERSKQALDIMRSLTPQQEHNAFSLLSGLRRFKNINLDITDPIIAGMLAKVVRAYPEGHLITEADIEAADKRIKEQGLLDTGERALEFSEEEREMIHAEIDRYFDELRSSGINVDSPGARRHKEFMKTNLLTPEQLPFDQIVESTMPQTDSEREARTEAILAEPPQRNRNKEKKEKGFSDTTIWSTIQALHNGELTDGRGRVLDSPHDIAEYEHNLYDGNLPRNLDDLAWQIGKSSPEFGVLGEFPVLEIVYKGTNRRASPQDLYDREKTEAKVNKGNFMRWVRERMMYQHDDNPDDELNFFQVVSLPKSYRPITLGDIIEHPGVYLKKAGSERAVREVESRLFAATNQQERDQINQELIELREKAIDEDLLDEIKREAWLFGNSRIFDLKYREVSGVPEELVKTLQHLFGKSPFTKTVWGNKASFYWIFTMDQDYHKVKSVKEGEEERSHDRRLGAAINTAYLAYFNLTDIYKLRQVLGQDSVLLSREGLKSVRDAVKRSDQLAGKEAAEGYMEDKDIDAIFDENGNIIEKNFIKTMNIWSTPQVNAKVEKIVRAAIQQDMTRIAGLYLPGKDSEGNVRVDKLNSHFAETYAYTMTRWTGAAGHNNLSAAGFDAWGGKFQHTEAYRMKMTEPGYGGGYGNPYTSHMLKMMATDFMTGVRTETKIDAEDIEEGNPFALRYKDRDRSGKNTNFKTPLEVLEEMHFAWQSSNDYKQGDELDDAFKLATENLDIKAGQLVFPGNTMKYFSNDHLKRALDMFNQVINAEEIKLEKFTRIDWQKGITFERDQFQSVVQEKFIKPMRYWARTWKQIDFSQKVRYNAGDDENPNWQYRSLAESMFGYEMLDIPEFWKQVEPGTPGAEKHYTRSKGGGVGWEWTWRIPHEISGAAVNSNRDQLVKQMAKVRLAAELFSHVDIHSNDPRYDFKFYETVIGALESIPGGIQGDEFDLKSSRANVNKMERFFSPDDIKWIRKKSRTTYMWTYGFAILKAILGDGLVKGGIEAFNKAAGQTIKGI